MAGHFGSCPGGVWGVQVGLTVSKQKQGVLQFQEAQGAWGFQEAQAVQQKSFQEVWEALGVSEGVQGVLTEKVQRCKKRLPGC